MNNWISFMVNKVVKIQMNDKFMMVMMLDGVKIVESMTMKIIVYKWAISVIMINCHKLSSKPKMIIFIISKIKVHQIIIKIKKKEINGNKKWKY
jgi:hypothetical protein